MIKTISFKDNELDLYEYAVENGGLSFVVKKLLREAMKGELSPKASTDINVADLLLLVDQLKNKISPNEEPSEIQEAQKEATIEEEVVDPEEEDEEVVIDVDVANNFLNRFTQ